MQQRRPCGRPFFFPHQAGDIPQSLLPPPPSSQQPCDHRPVDARRRHGSRRPRSSQEASIRLPNTDRFLVHHTHRRAVARTSGRYAVSRNSARAAQASPPPAARLPYRGDDFRAASTFSSTFSRQAVHLPGRRSRFERKIVYSASDRTLGIVRCGTVRKAPKPPARCTAATGRSKTLASDAANPC